ncbi:adenylate cyclase class 2 [Catenulispora sp. GP43]|uniref:class IV adenylate cyclase n=1 Tax=Catenulispora sp. GP43 TaxID=3156263 RepID=UPI00351689B1
MPIEAELKARVRDVPALLAALDRRAEREMVVCHDRYFDSPDGTFASAGHELRIRTVETDAGVRNLLTFRKSGADAASGSRPEYETTVGDADVAESIVLGLGYRPMVALWKQCSNYRWRQGGRDLLATVVTVPEIEGTFVELETVAEADGDLSAALDAARATLVELGIADHDLTTELYTDAVAAAMRASAA